MGVSKKFAGTSLTKWDFGIQVQGLKNCEGDSLRLIAVYNNAGMKKVAPAMRPILEESLVAGEAIVIAGDLNAHIGYSLGAFNEDDGITPSLLETLRG